MKSFCLRLIVAWVLVSSCAALAHAQGGATSSISGTVVDANGGVIPGATVEVKDNRDRHDVPGRHQRDRVVLRPRARGRHLHRDRHAARVQDRGDQRRAGRARHARVDQGRARSRPAQRDLTVKSSSELINTQTATVSSTLNADQLNRMPTPSRNALNAVTFLPGVNTAGINRDTTRQRPARVVHQHHARRRQQQRQLQQVDRRVLRLGDAAAGRGRSGHGDDRRAGRGHRRQRRRQHQLRDPLGHQPFSGSAYEYFRASRRSTRTTGSTNATACRRTTSS